MHQELKVEKGELHIITTTNLRGRKIADTIVPEEKVKNIAFAYAVALSRANNNDFRREIVTPDGNFLFLCQRIKDKEKVQEPIPTSEIPETPVVKNVSEVGTDTKTEDTPK